LANYIFYSVQQYNINFGVGVGLINPINIPLWILACNLSYRWR